MPCSVRWNLPGRMPSQCAMQLPAACLLIWKLLCTLKLTLQLKLRCIAADEVPEQDSLAVLMSLLNLRQHSMVTAWERGR